MDKKEAANRTLARAKTPAKTGFAAAHTEMEKEKEKPGRLCIVYNCDDAYCCHTAASIASLFDSNKEAAEICIYVLGNGICAESEAKLLQLARLAGQGRSLHVILLTDFAKQVREAAGMELDAGKFTLTALARMFTADFLPKTEQRALYLDCDTIVTGSLWPLFSMPLSGCAAAMAMEPTIYQEVRTSLGLLPDMPYFNAGMILMDLAAWRRENVRDTCMAVYRAAGGKFLFSDQDCLNKALKGRVLPVSQQWNFLSNYAYRHYAELVKTARWYGLFQKQQAFEAAKRCPVVVHFAGDERPWIAGNRNPYRKLYWKYIQKTAYHNQKPVEKKRMYMLAYHAVNVLTAVCPLARQCISAWFYKRHVSKM